MARKGQIALFAGNFTPKGWALCNGENGTPNIPDMVYDEYDNTISYFVATEDHEDFYLGFIYPTATDFAPNGWSFCDGQLMDINQNTALFSLLGPTYGGDMRKTFGLPKIAKLKTNNATDSGKNFIRYIICTRSGGFPWRS
ncbi:phage tail protein [Runella sp. SP2]|uniref:phage tail protein n=1 Tax=Runella sp. SP2 TaxID=2268026 RepID=UPI000F09541B|nr:hypothetical protein DTQ70_14585 [Runella sp. SP2]